MTAAGATEGELGGYRVGGWAGLEVHRLLKVVSYALLTWSQNSEAFHDFQLIG